MSSSTSPASALEIGIAIQSTEDPASDAREFERLGYDYATIGEHVSFNVPAANSFISLATAAGATERIKLLNTIALVPLYPPALLAKLGAALAVASGERFSLGVGIGGEIPAEFAACGVPVKERGARTNEALEIVTRLWSEDNVDFSGRFNEFEGVTISPRPSTPPPIWVSGRKEAAMKRTARFGDGWLPYMYTADMLSESMETIAGMRSDYSDASVRGGLFIWGCVHEDADTAHQMAVDALSTIYAQDFSRLVSRYCFAGDPDQVTRQLRTFGDAGAEMMVVSFACPGDHLDTARQLFADHVLPALRT